MFGSKTTRLLGEIDRLQYKKKNVLIVKPRIDKRYSQIKITSHNGGSVNAEAVSNAVEIYELLEENTYTHIAVDEAFMIDEIDDVLISLFKKGFSIIISTIQLDAEERPFENIKNMLPWATKIEICPAVCTMCDQDAYYTEALFDINNATAEERVGSYGMYEPRCAKHYTAFKIKSHI
tara:strand:- start:1100 stop:1633 length:534 start_codon:yes stop_codon:yes gene_type:complete